MKGRGKPNHPALVRFRFFDNPVVLRCGTTDIWAAWDLLYDAEYRPVVPLPCRTVVDCGANVGIFLVSLLKHNAAELQRYVGVEPDQASFGLLERQVRLFDVHDRVDLLNVAVYDRDTTLCFDDTGPNWEHRLSPAGSKRVRALSLPALLDSVGLEECDLLKVDIEGAEKELFESIGAWKARVKAIVCELHNNVTYSWFADLMQAAGFNPYRAGGLFHRLPGAIRADLDPFKATVPARAYAPR
jgi:FkbM family methyltransferase